MKEGDLRQQEKEIRALLKKVERLERARRIHEDMWDRNSNLFKKLNEEVEQQAAIIRKQNEELAQELALAKDSRLDALRRIEGLLVGDSPAVRGLKTAIQKYAETREPLLLVGDPGCGAEAVARAIHDASPSRDDPFVVVECAFLASRFHTAVFQPTTGDPLPDPTKYELAREGTLYFDGVDQLPAEIQSLLLGVLREAASDGGARIIAYTKNPHFPPTFDDILAEELANNQLRIPALTERRDDIPALVEHFLRRCANQLGKVFDGVADQSLNDMKRYTWPGNLRELGDVIRRSVISARGKVLQVDPALLEEGLPLGGYRLVERLGFGGMGEVWKARHQLLAREVAVKLVKPEVLGNPTDRDEMISRFRREAQATANLSSLNTVELYEFGVTEDGTIYYVMELLDGLDLERLVHQFGPLDISRAVRLLLQACDSLAEAHSVGLVHRDIKPANLYACRLGLQTDVLKILDFGLVTGVEGEDATRLTQDGVTFGTPATMSPESCTNIKGVDGRADVYSLACVAYWLLAARMPFEAETPTDLLFKHLRENPRPLSELGVKVPVDLEKLLLRCLAKKPENRMAAAEFSKALEATGLSSGWNQDTANEWWRENLPSMAERFLQTGNEIGPD